MNATASADTKPHTDTAGKLTVALDKRAYDIHVGRGLLARAPDLIKPVLHRPRVYIVSDSNVAPIYLEPLEAQRSEEHTSELQSH